MEKYSNISEITQLSIDTVSSLLLPIKNAYQEQIKGLCKEEANLIALEYIEELHTYLCQARIEEGLRIYKERKCNNG